MSSFNVPLVTTVIGFGLSSIFIVFMCLRLIWARFRSADSLATATFSLTSSPDVHPAPRYEELRLYIGELATKTCESCGQTELEMKGLEPVMVAAIPMMKYKRSLSQVADEPLNGLLTFVLLELFARAVAVDLAKCTICLGEYQDTDVLRIMPKCGHNFHLTCIDKWLQKHSTCPVCRLSISDSFSAKFASSPILRIHSTNSYELPL